MGGMGETMHCMGIFISILASALHQMVCSYFYYSKNE